MYPGLRTIQDPVFIKVTNIMQDLGYDENDDDSSDNVDDYDYLARTRRYLYDSTGNLEIK